MSSWIDVLARTLAERHRSWRRARNLGAASPRAVRVPARVGTVGWIGAAGAIGMLGGAVLIGAHARHLSAAAAPAGTPAANAEVFQAALPGASFEVGDKAGVTLSPQAGGTVLVASGMRAAAPVRIDLCTQTLADGRLLPVRIGYQFDEVARLARPGVVTQHNLMLAGPAAAGMPRVQVSGSTASPALEVRWEGAARWVGDGGAAADRRALLRGEGWLVWQGAALRLQRRPGGGCAGGGQLLAQLSSSAGDGAAAGAQVTAFPAQGDPVSAWLPPGRYQVPATPRASLEDQALFAALRERGLVRLGEGGLIEVVPRDLPSWHDAPAPERAAALAGWSALTLDSAKRKLIERLYRMADGDYVRAQIQVFNSERRLLGWRMRGSQSGRWEASVMDAPAAIASGMPPPAARLFADLPQGWAPWSRVGAWPDAGPGAPARLALNLAQPARAGQQMTLMLAGRLLGVDGARLRSAQDACSARACPSAAAVQVLTLDLPPGARTVTLRAAPLDMAGLSGGDRQYRHLRVVKGRLEWQALRTNSATARPAPLVPVTLTDRHGALLWSVGAPTQAALDAGLAPLLGLHEQHAASVAGMLARLPTPAGEPHHARLSLDLALQAASQKALDCIGLRHGRWDGAVCRDAHAVPNGRQAALVVIDAETGDVLAAAGAGGASVTPANWDEVRDFDRANPARSPLRLPAFQHDGGAHSSPGSTFKIVSALGLERAARADPQLDALLGGLPLGAIDRMARQKGFAFQTAASSYPADTRLVHITNYKLEQMDRHTADGRLGLAQALTYSINTWFAWSGELSDRSLFGRADGGEPDLQPLQADALDAVRPIVGMAHLLGFEQALRLDGGLLPPDYPWSAWDALQASPAHIDPIHTRHELRQMAIGLRMQVTPLQMALVAGAVGEGHTIAPRLLLSLDGRAALPGATSALGVRLDRVCAGMKGVVDIGTAAGAFRAMPASVRHGLSGKTGTAPTPDGGAADQSTVWFTGYLEPGSLPNQPHRLAVAAFVSHSETTGGEHAAPIVAAVLRALAGQKGGIDG